MEESDYANVEYDAEENKISFNNDVKLKDTLILPTDEATTIELGGNQITAPAGKSAVSAGSGKDVELIISNSGGENNGGITGNAAPVIDFNNATGNSKIELEHATITGSDGKNGSSEGDNGGSDTPTKPAAPTENYTIPVKNENTVQVEAKITDSKANVSEITTDTIDKVVKNTATESKVDAITIDLSGAKQEVTGVILSKTTVETLAQATAEAGNGIETATVEQLSDGNDL